MIEIRFRFIERALFNFHIRFGLMQVRRRLIDVSLRRVFFREQFLDPRRIHFGQFQGCLGIRHIALGLRHSRLKQYRIDLCDNVTRFHPGIKIGEKFLNIPRNLTATCTFTTGFKVPVAVTVCVIGPRVTAAV
jgi:hypothetical protein